MNKRLYKDRHSELPINLSNFPPPMKIYGMGRKKNKVHLNILHEAENNNL